MVRPSTAEMQVGEDPKRVNELRGDVHFASVPGCPRCSNPCYYCRSLWQGVTFCGGCRQLLPNESFSNSQFKSKNSGSKTCRSCAGHVYSNLSTGAARPSSNAEVP